MDGWETYSNYEFMESKRNYDINATGVRTVATDLDKNQCKVKSKHDPSHSSF